MPVKVDRTNNFGDFQRRIDRATGRAIIGIGMQVVVETKRITHKQEGTLSRSVHMAPVGYDGAEDLEEAATTDLLLSKGVPVPTMTPLAALIEVGSWLPYACVEWIGRKHPGITQGLEAVRGARVDAVVARAFREEGL